jgi:hypothetical protein
MRYNIRIDSNSWAEPHHADLEAWNATEALLKVFKGIKSEGSDLGTKLEITIRP